MTVTTSAKITALDAISASTISSSDVFVVVDVSDTTMAASGTDFKIRADELASTVASLVPTDGLVPGQVRGFTSSVSSYVYGRFLPLVAGGASVENIGAVESNVNTIVSTTTSQCSLDVSIYGVHDVTMGSTNCTFTFLNPAPSGKATVFVLTLRGAQTPTFPAAVKWASGTPPTYSSPTVYTLITDDGGTTYYGQAMGTAFA